MLRAYSKNFVLIGNSLANRPFKMLGTGPLLGQALQNVWDKPALGTCPLKCLGQARSWDMPFKMLGTGPLLGQALQNYRSSQVQGLTRSLYRQSSQCWVFHCRSKHCMCSNINLTNKGGTWKRLTQATTPASWEIFPNCSSHMLNVPNIN